MLPYGFRSISELLLYSIVRLGGNPQLLQLCGFYRMFQVWKGQFRAAFHLLFRWLCPNACFPTGTFHGSTAVNTRGVNLECTSLSPTESLRLQSSFLPVQVNTCRRGNSGSPSAHCSGGPRARHPTASTRRTLTLSRTGHLLRVLNSPGVMAHSQYQKSKRISIFLSMPDEIETEEIIKDIFRRGKTCFIPRYRFQSNHMDMVRLASPEEISALPKTSWNIHQPREDEVREEALSTELTKRKSAIASYSPPPSLKSCSG